MALPKSFKFDVREKDLQDGEQDYRDGAVRDLDSGPSKISAWVSEDEDHHVVLRRDDEAVEYQCTCKTFLRWDRICRHVWATLRTADALNLLDDWDLQDDDYLYAAEPEDDDVFEHDEADAEEVSGGPINERRIVTQSKPVKRQADWKSHLANLREAMLQAGARTVSPPVSDLQIMYMVDAPATLEGNGIALDLYTREKRKDGQWGKERIANVSPDTVARLGDPADRDILARLHGAKAGYLGYYASTGGTRFYLRPAQEEQILIAACQTGRLSRLDRRRIDPDAVGRRARRGNSASMLSWTRKAGVIWCAVSFAATDRACPWTMFRC